jgi:hypothetical protein
MTPGKTAIGWYDGLTGTWWFTVSAGHARTACSNQHSTERHETVSKDQEASPDRVPGLSGGR